jgi:hypothetical protein
VRESRLSAGEATYVGKELCRALAAVHHANLLHRDIKAQNVMRATDGGRIILMDFGAGEFRNAPSTGRRQGTPLYLAPELLTGGAATVESDIYSLGVLLYYLVTGRFPVEGNSLTELVLAHAQRARRNLRDARPDLPDTFVSVVERAIDSDPGRRFKSAGDFHAALEDREIAGPAPDVATTRLLTPAPAAGHQFSLLHALGAALVTAAAVGVSGLVACRTFEVVLNIGQEYSAGPTDYFRVGIQALIPFAFYWIVGLIIVALLAALRLAIGSRGDRLFGRWRLFINRLRPTTLATVVPVAGAIAWLAASLYYWPIIDPSTAVNAGTARAPAQGPLIYQAFPRLIYSYSQLTAVVSFFLIFAVWRWWPGIERRSDDVSAVRRAKWTCIALAAIVVLAGVGLRRFTFERFEVVLYKNVRSFVIRTRDDQMLLLYVPNAADTTRRTARRGDPELVSTDTWLPLAPH